MIPINDTVIEILIGAVAYILIAITLQRKLSNMGAVYATQQQMQQLSKELNDMAKANAPQEELLKKQKQITELLGQSMKNQLKPMLVTLPMFFIIYYGILPMAFASAPFPTIVILGITLTYKTLFFYTAFVLGLVISLSLTARDRKKYTGAAIQQAKPILSDA